MTDTTIHQSYYPEIFLSRLVNVLIGIIEMLLVLRIVLELFGASPASEFVTWIYNVSALFLGPFAGAFQSISLGGNSVIDVVAILAMIAYAILGWLLDLFIAFIFGRTVVV